MGLVFWKKNVMKEIIISVWVFNGPNGKFSGGVFAERQLAESWILKHKLTGTLTLYPLNIGVYDWTIANNFFDPSKEKEYQPDFIGSFSSASQEHYHYLNGEID